jgi:hypothetical protein
MAAPRPKRGPTAQQLRTYKVIWECMTRAGFELQGELVVKAPCTASALARVRERIGYRYAIPDCSVETSYCSEVIPRPRR